MENRVRFDGHTKSKSIITHRAYVFIDSLVECINQCDWCGCTSGEIPNDAKVFIGVRGTPTVEFEWVTEEEEL